MMLFRESKGFSLIEVVIAVLFLSLVTVAIVQIYNSSVLAIIFSGSKTKALYEAQQELEEEIQSVLAQRNLENGDSETITFRLKDTEETLFDVRGQLVEGKSTFGADSGKTVSIFVFIPDDEQDE